MAAYEERGTARAAEAIVVADPVPLALAAFALPLFMLGGYLADFIPNFAWLTLAFFMGGLVQLLAGMWAFRNRDVFGATAFSVYGGFWFSLAIGVAVFGSSPIAGSDFANGLAWFVLTFAIFNLYIVLAGLRYSTGIAGFFAALEVMQVLLVIALWVAAHRHIEVRTHDFVSQDGWTMAAGWAAIVTAALAWLASAATLVTGWGARWLAPINRPAAAWWGTRPAGRRGGETS